MPETHCEISVVEQQNRVDKDNKRRKKKKKKDDDDDAKEVEIVDDFEKGNQLLMPLISKSRNRLVAKIRKKPKSPNRCSSSRSGSRQGSCFPVIRSSRTKGSSSSSSSSPTSDPNDESFTHEMLRVMLETNDFSSHECNPHR